jgi:NAD(P)-dependent dehydrogenase (short-subunit alcohol dehydrogenase family)
LLKIKNKVVVITGGTSGLGKAMAKEFALNGAKVVIAARNQKHGEKTLNVLKEITGNCIFIRTDVSKYEQVEDLISAAVDNYGAIDFMINNAAIFTGIGDSIVDIKTRDWKKIFDVNVNGVFYGTQIAAKEMIKKGKGGRIVNVSSIIGVGGKLNCSSYAATKGAINSFTKNAAIDLAKHNILVNAIVPGVCNTEINASVPGNERKMQETKIPLGRWAEPEEIAKSTVFLCSGLSSYMTGQLLIVDGGYLAGKEVSESDSVLPKLNNRQ